MVLLAIPAAAALTALTGCALGSMAGSNSPPSDHLAALAAGEGGISADPRLHAGAPGSTEESSQPLVQPWNPGAGGTPWRPQPAVGEPQVGHPWTEETNGTHWSQETPPSEGELIGELIYMSLPPESEASSGKEPTSPDASISTATPSGGQAASDAKASDSAVLTGEPPPEAEQGCAPGEACEDKVEPLNGPLSGESPVALYPSGLDNNPDPEVRAAVLGVYLSFWENYWSASTHPVDPKGAKLHIFAAEPILSRARNVLSERTARGLALHFEDAHGEGRLLFIDKWTTGYAEVVDCIVDSAIVYDVNTGTVLNDEKATVVNRGLMNLTDEGWKVSEVFQQAIYKGKEEGCVLQLEDGSGGEATPAYDQAGLRSDQPADGEAIDSGTPLKQGNSRPGNWRQGDG